MAGVESVLRQRPLQDVVGFIGRLLPVSSLNRSFERVGDVLSDFGGEVEPLSIQFALLEEVIDEGTVIALLITVAGYKTGHLPLVFDRKLHEFAVLHE